MAAAGEDKAQEGWQRPGSQGLWVVMCTSIVLPQMPTGTHSNPFKVLQSKAIPWWAWKAYDGAVSRGGGEGVVHRERSGPVA